MRRTLLALSLILALPGAAAAQRVTLGATATFSSISELSEGYDASSGEVGWALGGNVRIGKTFFIAPGLWWQEVRFKLEDEQAGESDVMALRGFQVPVMVGLGFDLKVVGIDVYAGPTVTFLSKVGDNQFGLEKEAFKSTAFGGQIGAAVQVLFLTVLGSYEIPFTDVYDSDTPYGKGKLGVTRVGLGFRF